MLSLTFASFVLETNLSSARNWSEDDDDDGDDNDSDDDNNDDDDNGDDDDDDTDSDDDNNDDKHEINAPASSFLCSQKSFGLNTQSENSTKQIPLILTWSNRK